MIYLQRCYCTCLILVLTSCLCAQSATRIDSFYMYGDVKITVDRPEKLFSPRKTIVIFYALPNGNTTTMTMGKKMKEGDDWHYDIQHIAAQTRFIRRELPKKNIVVVYLENNLKSWPAWKQKHPGFPVMIPELVDSVSSLFDSPEIYLNGHSGGGSFIFGYLLGVGWIPDKIKRISFIDSDYGYDSSYYPAIRSWLLRVKGSALNVFAYNDSVALYNGKPLVSAKGGTWYRSHLILSHLSQELSFSKSETDSLVIYRSADQRVQFFFKRNLNRGIYHTQQVELNGFIHSVLCGTKKDSKGYSYYGKRAYGELVE
jgi:hypothetical protein